MPATNRNWKRRWTVNTSTREARHESGLVMSFTRPPGAAVNENEIFEQLATEHGQHAGARLARLLDEGRKIYGIAIERERAGRPEPASHPRSA